MLVCPRSHSWLSSVLPSSPRLILIEKGVLAQGVSRRSCSQMQHPLGWGSLQKWFPSSFAFLLVHHSTREGAELGSDQGQQSLPTTSWPPSAFSVAPAELTQQNSPVERAEALAGLLIQPPGRARATG